MARTLGETRIQDRTARSRLAHRDKPYWRMLSEGAHVGYFRGRVKGSWSARYHCPIRAEYVRAIIGEADDHREADGITILNYKQAVEKALRWIEMQSRGGGPATESSPDMTIAEAVTAYIAVRDARRSSRAGREVKSDASSNLTKFVLEDRRLPAMKLSVLSEADLRAWQLRIKRRKPSSIQRVVNDFKAALNAAFVEHRKVLPADLPTVIKFGLKVDAPEVLTAAARDNQILTDDEVRAVVTAAMAIDEDFGRLVVLLAATGARFSQIARMTVGDVQAGQGRLMVPQSFKGRKRVLAHIRTPVGADTLAVLAPAVEGRPLSAPLLEHWRHRQVGPMQWERVDRGPWASSSAMLRPFQRAVEEAGLPLSTIPYALRHSSIVRGLRAGLPIRLVAALHDTSVAMIERHYSRYITEGLDELVARAVVPIVAKAA
ncbi:tyrosine-type recombinase/integrase [Sphingomonas psychrotolerans]|uniref:Integrase n=1 Tax=Sphingomonas psychrotolerans TaxID=1327635 RepID=A0A2K8MIT0_9SPHN|nr:tyrosine-type recombinase/integrase [Sphingomonas psychrotolerans]ATY31091.1 integrase [Sphingomonas psychrotolerans]